MLQPDHRILRAWLTSPTTGIIELDADWSEDLLPLLVPGENAFTLASLEPARPEVYAETAAYFVDGEERLVFVLNPADYTWIDFERTPVYVAGDFNGWEKSVGRPEWQMTKGELLGQEVWMLRTAAAPLLRDAPHLFKFVTGDHRWLDLPPDSANFVADDQGHYNRALYAHRTGRNLFQFKTTAPLSPSRSYTVIHLRDGEQSPKVRLRLGRYFQTMRSALPLGAIVRKDETVFRLFAPRARHVRLFVSEKLEELDGAFPYELDQKLEGGEWRGVWEARLDRNLHGWFYWYSASGPSGIFAHFQPTHRILDPYALAAVKRDGPGIVLDQARLGKLDDGFRTPPWQDLVVAEAHVRDLAARAPMTLTADERLGFAGLTKWVESPDFYLKRLGVNCVELQPVQEFDNRTRDEYHWGYMTVNWFSPASAFSSDPVRASGVHELRELVAAFHRQGIAVVLDVVYNHVGEPAHLLFIDKLHYFELGDDGSLANWSGCGNDTRARSAMMKRLIIDSCNHLIETYGVDGFRFDLAELIGVAVLRDVEAALKRTKPDVILIAEPWSFRGHIAAALRPTGWASWNDNYRNFLRDYVHSRGGADSLEYFMKGSPWHFAYWPAQTVNYTESHDDRTWIDMITENGDGNGYRPTLNDVRRTHLMAAILFASVGIPMISAGQDFLRSKQGVNNTYQRGDLNALDYRRLARFAGTHGYFRDWIAFRRSPEGRLLRLWSRPGEGFFRSITGAAHGSLVLIYNADGSEGKSKLMFAINPTPDDATIAVGEVATWGWRLLADHDCFYGESRPVPPLAVESGLFIPALGCSLWVSET
ncbi:MAG TPA: alpha-amylase family glycosyl hydrolase [Candidatus Didemnitutus sp.]|nr:alpha-amylase family glycosyl hydrolase [Candidatus Didemnitutus sp.]